MKRMIPVVTALIFAGATFANGLGGQRLEKVVGGQIIDIGTDQMSTPLAGEPIQFDFNLLKSDTGDPIDNTSVNVDIAHNGKTMVISDLLVQLPITYITYTFPEAGTYTLKTTFYNGDTVLATGAFVLTISGSSIKTRIMYGAAITVGILFVLGVGYWIGRRQGVRSLAG